MSGRFVVRRFHNGEYRWHLWAPDEGRILAIGERAFATKEHALDSVAAFVSAVANATVEVRNPWPGAG
jgi:uncharacterized protein YegP (UPF0339 family)